MASAQRAIDPKPRRLRSRVGVISPRGRTLALLVPAALALLATACGTGDGDQTQCSTWVSMSNSDQQTTITNMLEKDGEPHPATDEVTETQRAASYYCAHPFSNISTLSGMSASRPAP